LTDMRLQAGLYAVERTGAASWRWTDGAAVIVLDAPGRLDVALGPVIEYWQGRPGLCPDPQRAVRPFEPLSAGG